MCFLIPSFDKITDTCVQNFFIYKFTQMNTVLKSALDKIKCSEEDDKYPYTFKSCIISSTLDQKIEYSLLLHY